MRKILWVAAGLAVMGAALAQMEASSSVYFLDIDPARYNGPPGQRIALQLGDEPRQWSLGAQDEICVQLQRAATDGAELSARVRALRPEPHEAAVVRISGSGISPGTYRATPWGMLMRVVSPKDAAVAAVKPVGLTQAPVCTL